jgi:hypothetical protein
MAPIVLRRHLAHRRRPEARRGQGSLAVMQWIADNVPAEATVWHATA